MHLHEHAASSHTFTSRPEVVKKKKKPSQYREYVYSKTKQPGIFKFLVQWHLVDWNRTQEAGFNLATGEVCMSASGSRVGLKKKHTRCFKPATHG